MEVVDGGGGGAFQSSASGRLGALTTTGANPSPTPSPSSPPLSTTRREVVSPPLSSPLAILRPGGTSYGRREGGDGQARWMEDIWTRMDLLGTLIIRLLAIIVGNRIRLILMMVGSCHYRRVLVFGFGVGGGHIVGMLLGLGL